MSTRTKQSPLQGVEWPTEPFFKATMPLPPGLNSTYKTGKGIFYSSAESKAWKEEALVHLNAFKNANHKIVGAIFHSGTKFGGNRKVPLELHIDFYFPTLWKRDVDGGIKIVQDIVFKALNLNDNLVKRLIVEKHADASNTRCEISLSVCLERMK